MSKTIARHRRLVAVLVCVLLGASLSLAPGTAGAASDTNPSFELIRSDLEFIL